MMTFDELEKAKLVDLREAARQRFDRLQGMGESWGVSATILAETQFYMSEMERRESARIGRRDFRMELIVIALIALELIVATWGIYLSLKESKEQAQVMERQIQLLEKVEKAMIRAGNMNLLRR